MVTTISGESEKEIISSIKRFFAEFLDEEIGDLKASLLLKFVLEEIGPCVYNQAILDAQARLQESVSDLDEVCYEPEFGYWDKS